MRIAVPALLVMSIASTATAADWPEWLGPDRQSTWREDGIIEKFPEDGPPVKWRMKVGGGYAGPAVAAGRVYLTDYLTQGDTTPNPSTQNKLEGTERVLCLDAKSGKEIWKHEYSRPYEISYPAGPRCTPTVDGDVVYTLGAEGNLKCLRTKDGSVVWEKDFQADFGAKAPWWGHCGHPLVEGDRLFCLVGGEGSVVVAFDKRSGKELSRTLSASQTGYCPPTMIEAGGTKQLLIWHADAICSLDPASGQEHWSFKLKPNYGMSIPTPRLSGNRLFVGGYTNVSMLLRLASDKPAAEEVWRGDGQRGIGPVNMTPFVDGDFLYGVDHQGDVRCVKLETGERMWSTLEPITRGKRQGSATGFIVRHQDRFFLASEDGSLIIAKMTPDAFTEISRAKLLEPTTDAFGRKVVWSHPAFAERCVFARNDKELVCASLARN